MIQPPSIIRRYDEFYSRDPAFVQRPVIPPDTADDAERKQRIAEIEAYDKLLRTARETGDWTALRVDGAPQPSRFTMRPMPGHVYRALADLASTAGNSMVTLAPLAFRACIVEMHNVGEHQIKREIDPKLGDIATVATTNYLDEIDLGIVSELGALLMLERGTRGLAPK